MNHADAERQNWMGVLARAEPAALAEHLAEHATAWGALGPHTALRGPEVGLAMVRGRAGGGGAPFNLGEVTVTRCVVRDASGRVGHALVRGRDRRHAEQAAALDAALQDPTRRPALLDAVVEPLRAREAATRAARAAEAAGTRVEFFTLGGMRA